MKIYLKLLLLVFGIFSISNTFAYNLHPNRVYYIIVECNSQSEAKSLNSLKQYISAFENNDEAAMQPIIDEGICKTKFESKRGKDFISKRAKLLPINNDDEEIIVYENSDGALLGLRSCKQCN